MVLNGGWSAEIERKMVEKAARRTGEDPSHHFIRKVVGVGGRTKVRAP